MIVTGPAKPLRRLHDALCRDSLLEVDGLQHKDEAALGEALLRWKESKAGFTDCMLAAKAGLLRRQPFMTLDAAAARLPGAQLLR